jgi:fucose permease
MSSKIALLGFFFLHAFTLGSWLTRIADLQTAWQVTESQLGLVLIGQPIGALCLFSLSGFIIEKFDMITVFRASLTVMVLAITLVGAAPGPVSAALLLTLYGAGFALGNIAINVEADRYEAATNTLIMNTCHGLWSFGLLTSSMVGVALRGSGMSVPWHFALIAPIFLVLLLTAGKYFVSSPPRHTDPGARRRRRGLVMPTAKTFPLVGVILAAVLIDTGTHSWSVIFMRDTFDIAKIFETAVLPVYLLAMTIFRLSSDHLISIIGRVRLAYVMLATSIFGLIILGVTSSAALAYFGFILMGIGISTMFPMIITAAAQLNDRPAADNVAAVVMTLGLVMLGAPALMGLIAENFGIRTSFVVLVVPALIALWLVPVLRPLADGQQTNN